MWIHVVCEAIKGYGVRVIELWESYEMVIEPVI